MKSPEAKEKVDMCEGCEQQPVSVYTLDDVGLCAECAKEAADYEGEPVDEQGAARAELAALREENERLRSALAELKRQRSRGGVTND